MTRAVGGRGVAAACAEGPPRVLKLSTPRSMGAVQALKARVRSAPGQLGLGCVVAAALLWGTTGIASRLMPPDLFFQPQTFGFFRLVIGAPVLFGGALLILGAGGGRLERRHLPLTALFGLMIAVYQIAFFTAVEHLGVALGTLLPLGTTPLFAAGFAAVLLREHLPIGVLLACVMAIAGVACLAGVPASPLGLLEMNLVGIGAGLAGGAAFALVTVLGRVLARRSAPPLLYTAVGFLFGAGVLLPLALRDSAQVLSHWDAWPALLYLGVVPSALAYLLYAYGMMRVRTTATGATTMLLEPAAAVGLACLLLGERLTLAEWAGTGLLLLALVSLFRVERAAEHEAEL